MWTDSGGGIPRTTDIPPRAIGQRGAELIIQLSPSLSNPHSLCTGAGAPPGAHAHMERTSSDDPGFLGFCGAGSSVLEASAKSRGPEVWRQQLPRLMTSPWLVPVLRRQVGNLRGTFWSPRYRV